MCLPLVTTGAVLRGLLEAQQRFGIVTGSRILMALFTFAAPLLVLPVSSRLQPAVAMMMFGRIATLATDLTAEENCSI